MNRAKASRDIMELFIKAVHQYNALEKLPSKAGTKHDLYHSERHFLDKIGDHPGMNMTEFAGAAGITKGAVSQVVKKLENKGLVKRYKSSVNNKEVFIELTRDGRDLYREHKKKNEETVGPLIKELGKYQDDKVDFLIAMFTWIGNYLEESKNQMKAHQ